MKTQDEIKAIFTQKAFNIGKTAAHANYHDGYKADDGHDKLRLLVDLWEQMANADYAMTWVWVDNAYDLGQIQGKKDIKNEKRRNNRRIAKMNAEAELNVNGFGL